MGVVRYVFERSRNTTRDGLFNNALRQSAAPPLGMLFIRLASKFQKATDKSTPHCCKLTQSEACLIRSLIRFSGSVPPKVSLSFSNCCDLSMLACSQDSTNPVSAKLLIVNYQENHKKFDSNKSTW